MAYNRYFNDGGEKTPFNFAELLLRRCDALFTKANEYAVLGDYLIVYRILKALRRTIIFKIDDTEKKNLNEKFKSIKSAISNPSKTNINFDAEEKLDEIETKIIDLMYKYGLYYPKYEKKKWEDEVEGEDV